MLTRRVLFLLLTAAMTAAAATVAASPASAEDICYWVGDEYVCEPVDPGSGPGGGGPGGPGGGGGSQTCTWHGRQVPCFTQGYGWLNPQDGCYYVRESPQPPAGDPAWAGHPVNDGAVYRARCWNDGADGVDPVGLLRWRQNPPPGTPGGLTPAQLAQRAIASMGLSGAAIRTSVEAGKPGLVGAPIWMWTEQTPTTWGPNQLSATAGGITVMARAQVTRIVWNMGDGNTVSCQAGTAYNANVHGISGSPDCGHVYRQPSATAANPAATYRITTTSYWHVNWWVVGGGATGTDSAVRNSAIALDVDELQVITS